MPRQAGASRESPSESADAAGFTFVQRLMRVGCMPQKDALDMLEELTGSTASEVSLNDLVGKQNLDMSGLGLRICTLRNPADRCTYVGFVNTLVDAPAKLGSRYSPAQREYFKRALEAIVAEGPVAPGVPVASSALLLNLELRPSSSSRGTEQSSGEGGEAAAEQQAAEEAALAAARKLTKREREATLAQLASDRWLAQQPGAPGFFCVGVRSFMELGDLLLSFDLSDATRAVWESIL